MVVKPGGFQRSPVNINVSKAKEIQAKALAEQPKKVRKKKGRRISGESKQPEMGDFSPWILRWKNGSELVVWGVGFHMLVDETNMESQ
jgi:hypothetical protein